MGDVAPGDSGSFRCHVIPACRLCGKTSQVHIRIDASTDPLILHYCAACADEEQLPAGKSNTGGHLAAISTFAGSFLMFVSLAPNLLRSEFADVLADQIYLGPALAATLLFIGAVTRVPSLIIMGLFAGGLSFLAGNAVSWGISNRSWQITGCIAGAIMCGLGLGGARVIYQKKEYKSFKINVLDKDAIDSKSGLRKRVRDTFHNIIS